MHSKMTRTALALVLLHCSAQASIFVVAISKDGIVAVADSRFAFTDADNPTGQPVAYADGLNKIIRFDSAVIAETGQGFVANERFDQFVQRFAKSAGPLPADEILPALLEYGVKTLPPEGIEVLSRQHMAAAKFKGGKPMICGFDGHDDAPCIGEGFIQSSPTDFDQFRRRLGAMLALDVAEAARASMQRYITARGKNATMGGEFSAALVTPSGVRELWALKNPIPARSVDELIALVLARKIQVTLVPPAKWADLQELLDSGPAR